MQVCISLQTDNHARYEQLPQVIGVGAQWATTNVRQKATVVCEVRGSRSNERLMYEPLQLLTELLPISQLGEQRHDGCEQSA